VADDIEVQPENMNAALHGDEVELEILKQGSFPRPQGKVTNVITRSKTKFVGTLSEDGKDVFYLTADDRRLYRDIFIRASNSMGAHDGDKVYAEITSWQDPEKSPEGKVLKVLGRKGVHNVEMQSIVLEKGFESEFPEEIDRDAERIVKESALNLEEDLKTRRDFRGTLTFTIDPATAKDFDDALSFKNLDDGKYEIGIHIADVSHYVREGTILDKEAEKRGTSIYLVDRTIPMLPEILSNDVCSLNPDVDRMTFSAVFELDDKGKVSSRWFGKTVIHSDRRFTYEEAQQIIDYGKGEYVSELTTLNNIAKKLQAEKAANGAIEFENDEVRFVLDDTGKPIKVYKKERLETHKLIEEFMLLANREVAKFMFGVTSKNNSAGPFVYRIHDLPDKDKIANLNIFLKALGYDLHAEDGEVTAEELNAVLTAVSGKPEESLVKTAAIRSMSKAVYSTRNIGHFGLGFEFYTHFTSPIRRYPDLLVHRLLERHLIKGKIGKDEQARYDKLTASASEKEIAAADAERTSIKYKQVEFLMTHIGETFNATVSGVSEWGVYVEEVNTKADGMVRLRDMTDDFYTLDEKNYCIVGAKSKKRYALGDKVKVKLTNADLDRRTLDFVFV
jgi:ribonuclease R